MTIDYLAVDLDRCFETGGRTRSWCRTWTGPYLFILMVLEAVLVYFFILPVIHTWNLERKVQRGVDSRDQEAVWVCSGCKVEVGWQSPNQWGWDHKQTARQVWGMLLIGANGGTQKDAVQNHGIGEKPFRLWMERLCILARMSEEQRLRDYKG
eukprot:Hpha_TRINITY_DN13902_c0_g1::TRINITY_DN13902_c0_g1_i1::g.35600::m.35600